MLLNRVQLLKDTFRRIPCVGRKFLQFQPKLFSVLLIASIAGVFHPDGIFCQCGMDPVLQPGPLLRKNHPGTKQLPLVKQWSWRYPHGRKSFAALKIIQPLSIRAIGLVHRRRHHLRLSSMNKFGGYSCFLNITDDLIPVAFRFYGDWGPRFTLAEQFPDCTWMLLYTYLEPYLSVEGLNRCEVVPPVGI